MRRLLSSPRRRRRLIWVGSLALVAGAVAALTVAIGGTSPPNTAAVRSEGPAQAQPVSLVRYRLHAADRRKIDALLNQWVPAGIARKSPALAWSLSGPELRSGSTLSQWRAGTSPIPYYPVAGTTFDGWRTIDVGPGYVNFHLLVHAKRSSKLPDWVFAGQVVRQGSGWVVNRIYTIAIMNPVRANTREIGPADFVAPSSTPSAAGVHSTLGRTWVLPAFGILALILLIPIGLGIAAFVRARRWKRAARAQGRNQLPPLPTRHLQR